MDRIVLYYVFYVKKNPFFKAGIPVAATEKFATEKPEFQLRQPEFFFSVSLRIFENWD